MNLENNKTNSDPDLISDEPSSVHPVCQPLTKFRQEICQKFLEFRKKTGLTHEQIAILISTDKARVSNIMNRKIDDFSTDRLIIYLQGIHPKTKIKII